jgi:uncharacterized protein YdeI (YjbR/CyaY-like superfamily)
VRAVKNADLETLSFVSPQEFREWLSRHAASSEGIWLKIAKKGSGLQSVTYQEALDAALCVGWIDGQKRPLDDAWWLQKFTPRRRNSPWSQRNRTRAEQLISEGRMQEAGLQEIEAAKRDGRWERSYAGQSTAEVPPDLAAALAREPKAAAFFETLSRGQRYSFIYRLQSLKRPETRAARVEQYIVLLRDHQTLS